MGGGQGKPCLKVASENKGGWWAVEMDTWERKIPGGGNNRFKGPEATARLVGLRNGKEVDVAGTQPKGASGGREDETEREQATGDHSVQATLQLWLRL